MKKQIKTIHIEARRWWQKSYGNTYHSVRVYVNDEILENRFTYGYGDHFFQTAGELLINAGYEIPDNNPYWLNSLTLWETLHGTYSVMDVNRKKDL